MKRMGCNEKKIFNVINKEPSNVKFISINKTTNTVDLKYNCECFTVSVTNIIKYGNAEFKKKFFDDLTTIIEESDKKVKTLEKQLSKYKNIYEGISKKKIEYFNMLSDDEKSKLVEEIFKD